MKILIKFVAVLLLTSPSFAKPAKEKSVRFPVLKLSTNTAAKDKMVEKINNIIIKDFSVNNAKVNDVIQKIMVQSQKSDDVHSEGISIIFHTMGELKDKIINWEKLPPMSLGALIDKFCDEFDCKWRAEANCVLVGHSLPPNDLSVKTYSVPPAFVKIILSFPYLKTNKSKMKKVALNEKNLVKGFKRFDVSFDNPIRFNNFKHHPSPEKDAAVSYDPAKKELTATTSFEDIRRINRLVANWEKEKGGWKPFYRYLKMETKLRDTKISTFKAIEMPVQEALALLEKDIKSAEQTYNEGIKIKNELPADFNTKITLSLCNLSAYETAKYICQCSGAQLTIENGEIVVFYGQR